MKQTAPPDDKVARREAKALAQAADAAFATGDYGATVRLSLAAVHLGPDTAVGHKALQRANMLATDPMAVRIGLASMFVYGLAWAYALSR
jgi:hypothetical protein